MNPDLATIRRGIRAGIHSGGGIVAVAVALGLGDSTVGEWHAREKSVIPKIEHAFAIDEIAVSLGRRPEVMTAWGRALGYVCIPLPQPCGDDALTHALIEASAEFGDVAQEVREATRDGEVSPRERERIITAIDEAITALVAMRQGLEREMAK